jgi:hypothetical protein
VRLLVPDVVPDGLGFLREWQAAEPLVEFSQGAVQSLIDTGPAGAPPTGHVRHLSPDSDRDMREFGIGNC